jgi:AraC-like DNA-binding protein
MAEKLGCKIPIGMDEALREVGIAPAEVLARSGLPSRLFEIAGRVPVPEYFALWDAVRSSTDDPGVGIRLARALKPDLMEPLFLAILSSADAISALRVISAFKRMLSPEDLLVSEDEAGLVVVTYVWPADADEPPQALVDAELAFLVEVCRRGTRLPELSPQRVELRTPALEDAAAHAEFFRCPIRLGAPANSVAFSAQDSARRFVTHNPQLLGALMPYLQANTPPGSAVARVRSVIADRLRGTRPTLSSAGRELAMSGRSLQRVLKENGTSFRELLDEVRNEHARGYLARTTFSDGEVAFLLGYEDPNSFYRAFRSWTGMSPSQFRRLPQG